MVLNLNILLLSCNSGGDVPGIEGHVVKVENGTFLVVSSVPEDYSSTGGVKEYYNAIWFSNAPNNIQIGQKVQVWFDEVLESYPGRSNAKKVSILPTTKPDNADLSETEAIQKALVAQGENGLTIMKSITYDAKSDTWTMIIKQALQEEAEHHVTVDDE